MIYLVRRNKDSAIVDPGRSGAEETVLSGCRRWTNEEALIFFGEPAGVFIGFEYHLEIDR